MLIALIPASVLIGQQYDLVAVLVPTLLMATIPIVLTERLLKRSMRNWLVYTLVGTLIGLLWFGLFPWDSKDPLILFLFSLSGVWPSFVQSLWLRQRVKRAWTWATSHIVVFQVSRFLLPQGIPMSEPLQLMIWTFVQQALLALVMHDLWTQPANVEKAKVDAEASQDEQSDEARLERLQELDRHDEVWTHEDPRDLRNEV